MQTKQLIYLLLLFWVFSRRFIIYLLHFEYALCIHSYLVYVISTCYFHFVFEISKFEASEKIYLFSCLLTFIAEVRR